MGFRRLGEGGGGLPYVSPLTPNAVLFVNAAGTKATTSTKLLYEESESTLAILLDGTTYSSVADQGGLLVKKNSGAVSAIFDAGGAAPNIVQLRNGGGGARDSITSSNIGGFSVGGSTSAPSQSGITLDPGNAGSAQITATTDHFVVSPGSGPIVDINATNNLQFQVDGTAGNPAVGFSGSTGLGLYRAGANVLGIASSGAEVARVTATGVGVVNGAVGAPALFFTNSATTGLYRSAANVVGIAANGTAAMTVAQNQVVIRPGTVGTPSFVFTSGDTTGMYRNAANDVAFAAGGVRQGGWTSSGFYFLNKASFFGVAAVGQRAKTSSGAAAGATYGANEQAMLNDVFNTLIGLGPLA